LFFILVEAIGVPPSTKVFVLASLTFTQRIHSGSSRAQHVSGQVSGIDFGSNPGTDIRQVFGSQTQLISAWLTLQVCKITSTRSFTIRYLFYSSI
jgi:hypothetical protein